MNHKRKRPRSQRAGCKFCKPWKQNGVDKESEEGEAHSDHVRRTAANREILRHESAAAFDPDQDTFEFRRNSVRVLEELPQEDDTEFSDPDHFE